VVALVEGVKAAFREGTGNIGPYSEFHTLI
jgi:hypothetical protein